MNSFDLEVPILEFSAKKGQSQWTIRDACEGVFIAGGIGAGKTSSSGATLAKKYLSANFGGLVLTAKVDEKAAWIEYCRATGREKDLIIIEPGNSNYFNFLEYISATTNGEDSITENIVEVLKTVIEAAEAKSTGKNNDPFWNTALDLLIFNTIDLCRLAYGSLSVLDMYNIVQTIPKGDNDSISNESLSSKAFRIALNMAKDNIDQKIHIWYESLPHEVQNGIKDGETFETAFLDAIPDARLLKFVDQFFNDTFIPLSGKTRSIIDFTFSGFLFRLLRDPIYSLFCKHKSTVVPEDCLDGKIILINLPVKKYNKAGRDSQILFKYIWQRAMEKRNVAQNGRPIFLWADESQQFLHEHDADYQATARSSRICTVYISQNLPNYYASMGGEKSEYKVKSFLGTLATKIFHANADVETNRYASELVGDAFFEEHTSSHTISKEFSQSKSRSHRLERVVRPEDFVSLRTGGPRNNFRVEAYIHKQGDPILNDQNFIKTVFNQL